MLFVIAVFEERETLRADVTNPEESGQRYYFVFLDQTGFEKQAPKNFAALVTSFTEYKS